MNFTIPEIMKAAFVEKESGRLIMRNVPVPKPGDGEVLIKIAAAPINPSDTGRIKTMMDNPEELLSFIPGIEGSGTVVAHGKGLLPKLWSGKRVSCSSTHNTNGTWAEYMVTSAGSCFPLPDDISDEQGSMLLVNPMTAAAFFDIIKKQKHKAVINTAAGGQLGKMVELLGKKSGIPVINIVRNEKQASAMRADNFEYVLNSSSESFAKDLHSLAEKLNATLALDCVGGNLTLQLIKSVPYDSSVIIYGNLSGEQPEIDFRELIQGNKKISGFFLGHWAKENGLIKTVKNISQVKSLLKKDMKIKVRDRFPLEKAQHAMEFYLNNMSEGKVLLVPAV